jgi:hypothetical protein
MKAIIWRRQFNTLEFVFFYIRHLVYFISFLHVLFTNYVTKTLLYSVQVI